MLNAKRKANTTYILRLAFGVLRSALLHLIQRHLCGQTC